MARQIKDDLDAGRWRRISTRLWNDADFRKLSPIPPCGQGLWMYLLTTPATSSVPGLFRARESGLAEDLGWPLEAFRKAFKEAKDLGWVEADWEAGLVWVRRAVIHDPPASPNVCLSWGKVVRNELPECPLRDRAVRGIYECLSEGLENPEPYLASLLKVFPWLKEAGPRGLPEALGESRTRHRTPEPDTGEKRGAPAALSLLPDPIPEPTVEKFQEMWNAKRTGRMKEWRGTAATRRKCANARLKERPLYKAQERPGGPESWETIIELIATSPFCTGQEPGHDGRTWGADADWFLRPGTQHKVLEGAYAPRGGGRVVGGVPAQREMGDDTEAIAEEGGAGEGGAREVFNAF